MVRSDPGIAYESLYNQMVKLIVQPLKECGVSTVVVIDALDECKDKESASAILSVLGRLVSEVPKVKFFLTGRPEPRIREGFRLPLLAEATDVFLLHDVKPNLVNKDIRLYFEQSFQDFALRRQWLENWPAEEQLDFLCERAAGLFVYAVATIKFIGGRNSNPKKRLDILLRMPKSTAQEGKTKFNENTTLDSLYTSILQEAFSDDDPEDDPKVRSVLGAVVLAANPLSPLNIATLLNFDTEDITPFLSSVHSLLILQEDINNPVRPFHKSFPDFITDPTRCINQRFHIFPPDHHLQLLVGCLELMGRKLERNMCKLPEATTNSEVGDLQDRTEEHIGSALQYACRTWHKHFTNEDMVHHPKFTSALRHFLEKKFLFWLEVLSVLGATREAVVALGVAAKWLKVCLIYSPDELTEAYSNWVQESPILDLVNDCFKFVTTFFEVISESAPHICHSALPLSPHTSIVQEQYKQYAQPFTRIFQGLPTSWELSITTKRLSSEDTDSVISWSPCSQFIAATSKNAGEPINVLDPMTLDHLTILRTPLNFSAHELFFSPDSNMLTCFSLTPDTLITFDIQTGGLVSTISLEHQSPSETYPFHTYSKCGTMFASLQSIEGISTVHTYNILSGTHIDSISLELDSQNIWADGECLQLAALESEFITIWEIGFTLEHPAANLQSLPVPDSFHLAESYFLLPTLYRLAFIVELTAYIWDAQNSKFLLEFSGDSDVSKISLTSDGSIACIIDHLEIYLWKESPTGYILHKKIIANNIPHYAVAMPSLSPDGEFLAVEAGSTLQAWHTRELIASTTPAQNLEGKLFILGFSPDGLLAAITQFSHNTVTVLSLKSGTPQLIIDTGLEICGLGIAGDVIVVVGDGKVIAWNVPAGNCARVNINNSSWTTVFDYPTFIPKASRFRHIVSVSSDLHYMAITIHSRDMRSLLYLFDVSTGQCLREISAQWGCIPFFATGDRIWYNSNSGLQGWSLIKDSESGKILLEDLEPTQELPEGCPQKPSDGYKITDGGWILNSREKQLLWLPPHWRSDEKSVVWSGQFLAFLHHQLPEAVIIELLE